MQIQAAEPLHRSSPFFHTDEGEICFSFRFATVQISYARPGSACLPSANLTRGTAGVLAEVNVYQPTENRDGNCYGVASFPFSPKGFPLGFATVEQVAAIIHWASLLEACPRIPDYEHR